MNWNKETSRGEVKQFTSEKAYYSIVHFQNTHWRMILGLTALKEEGDGSLLSLY